MRPGRARVGTDRGRLPVAPRYPVSQPRPGTSPDMHISSGRLVGPDSFQWLPGRLGGGRPKPAPVSICIKTAGILLAHAMDSPLARVPDMAASRPGHGGILAALHRPPLRPRTRYSARPERPAGCPGSFFTTTHGPPLAFPPASRSAPDPPCAPLLKYAPGPGTPGPLPRRLDRPKAAGSQIPSIIRVLGMPASWRRPRHPVRPRMAAACRPWRAVPGSEL